MAFKYGERVQESTTSTGTGDLVLAGVPDSTYQLFSAVFANGDTTDVAIFGAGGFESCRATYNTGANSITRGTRYASSNGGAAVNFSAGTKTVIVCAPGALSDFIGTATAAGRTLINGADAAAQLASIGALSSVVLQVFAATGTYTPTAGMKYCIIECWGSGAGGGGTTAATSTGTSGGGGGSGSYSLKRATAADIGASKAVTVGNAGPGGTAGTNNGTAGSDVSVGTLCIAKGGSGGLGSSNAVIGIGGAGGVTGTGDIVIAGQSGFTMTVIAFSTAWGGSMGGSSTMGAGGTGGFAVANAVAGSNATGFGGGGGGAGGSNSTATAAGGNGSKGLVIITEFI